MPDPMTPEPRTATFRILLLIGYLIVFFVVAIRQPAVSACGKPGNRVLAKFRWNDKNRNYRQMTLVFVQGFMQEKPAGAILQVVKQCSKNKFSIKGPAMWLVFQLF